MGNTNIVYQNNLCVTDSAHGQTEPQRLDVLLFSDCIIVVLIVATIVWVVRIHTVGQLMPKLSFSLRSQIVVVVIIVALRLACISGRRHHAWC
jgi:hypothetical protein